MTDPDPDDDAQLKSLRAAWSSLPDEDPPERGMGELLAAARAKAEQMASPPWWRRVFDMVRRPPVLAFATLTVLVGGAVLIGRHGEEIEPPRQSAPVSRPADNAPQTEQQPPAVVAPTPEIEKPVSPPPPRPRPVPQHAPTGKAPGRVPVAPKNVKTETPPPDLGGERLEDTSGVVDGQTAPEQDDVKTVVVKTKPSGRPSTSAQCRAAAARGDCSAALACVARIVGKEREQLATDKTIAKCMTAQ